MNMEWSVSGYQDIRELGSGGSGRVALALHEETGTPVAIKYLAPALSQDADYLQKFRAEARLLDGLESPYVVRLYEYVEEPGGAAIVMELVDGIALRALLREAGATTPEAALVVLKGSLLGLAAAHRVGVVHRDYKPENVLVSADGSSKLVDFGIAVRSGHRLEKGKGAIAGTPPYMSPEQWAGRPASPASDVYAATATFFECLTGARPYPGTTLIELAVQHTTAPIPAEETPEPVRPLILRGLAKDAEERPAGAAAFVEELEAVAGAAYGPDWERRGQADLLALAALLPLLFPSAGGIPGSTTSLATTVLGPPVIPPPAPGRRRPVPRKVALSAGIGGVVLLGAMGVAAVGPAGGSVPVAVSTYAATAAPGTAGPSTAASTTSPSSAAPSTGASASPSTSPSPNPATASAPPAATPTKPGATPAPGSPTPSPAGGTPSAGPPAALTVPSVLGLSAAAAEQRLTGAGFARARISVDATACTGPQGVYAQSPAGGSQGTAATAISLSAMAPDCRAYLNETGANPVTARQALRARGFTNVAISPASCNYGYYPVSSQSPAYYGQYLSGGTPIVLRSLCVPG
ncbi:protein kinase [Streptacidiphilus sp. EB129]|uniref:protein kinase domain-containing protein n=1 Tax=Streptacidiphilus sp. EB129 TaxID=3156262 RepID=UPI003517B867